MDVWVNISLVNDACACVTDYITPCKSALTFGHASLGEDGPQKFVAWPPEVIRKPGVSLSSPRGFLGMAFTGALA